MVRFVKVKDFVLMKIGKTANNFEVTIDMFFDSFHRGTFDCVPIVLNNNGEFKDYRNDKVVADYFENKVIGVVIPDTVRLRNSEEMIADVLLLEKYKERTNFDNWYCSFDENGMEYLSCELFSDKEVN